MANQKISELTAASTPLTGTEVLPIVQGGSTVKATVQDVADLAGGGSYLKYVAMLGQIGTDAPQVIILENTIGNIVWTRDGSGDYYATLTGAFPDNKTWCSAISGANVGNSGYFNFCRDNSNRLRLIFANGSVDINTNDGGAIVYECSIEIRIYP